MALGTLEQPEQCKVLALMGFSLIDAFSEAVRIANGSSYTGEEFGQPVDTTSQPCQLRRRLNLWLRLERYNQHAGRKLFVFQRQRISDYFGGCIDSLSVDFDCYVDGSWFNRLAAPPVDFPGARCYNSAAALISGSTKGIPFGSRNSRNVGDDNHGYVIALWKI